MSVNAVMRDLEQKQRRCTRLQAAIQLAAEHLRQALSKRDNCRNRLNRETMGGQSVVRQDISMFVRCRTLTRSAAVLLSMLPTDTTTFRICQGQTHRRTSARPR